MDSRNPFSPKMKIASSSKQPTDNGSSRNVDAEIGSSSKQPIDIIGSSRNVDAEIGSSSNQPRLEQTITDPDTKDTYLLNSEIGSFSNGSCPVYRALFSNFLYGTGRPFPRGYVTLKIINQHCIFQPQNPNIIRCMKTFIASNSLCVSLPYMFEGSLRSILSTRPEKKLPENFIPVVLKQVVVGLQTKVHVFCTPTLHKSLNAGDILVDKGEEKISKIS
ncbi:hypothetical protein RDI58_024134 [Solanum bulbocastanum]|uniref:Protein kinase domain-containing protein n=1 Tax=Solanum bulbocastanum TaxID=147425 RepID=A0AAN8Y365_SOLBU